MRLMCVGTPGHERPAVVVDGVVRDVQDLTARGHVVRAVFESSEQSYLAKPLGIEFR